MNLDYIYHFLLNIIDKFLNVVNNISNLHKNMEESPPQLLENEKMRYALEEMIKNDFYDEDFIYFILGWGID